MFTISTNEISSKSFLKLMAPVIKYIFIITDFEGEKEYFHAADNV